MRFDNGDELPMGIISRTYSWGTVCGDPKIDAITELDLVFDDETNWYFGDGVPNPDQWDFETFVLHELGHAHQLEHVVDNEDVMFYGLALGQTRRLLGANDATGAEYIMERSCT